MTNSKVAVVAGGSAGIGRACVDALVAEGFHVGVLARDEGRLGKVSRDYGAAVHTLSCDVREADAVTRAASKIEEALGPIDCWVNCAMATSFSPFPEMDPDEFEAILHTTFIGVVNGTRAALNLMTPRNRGRIVTVGSGLGYQSVPFQSAYCASKHAINGFTDSIRSELIRSKSEITMSVVQLPAVNTPQFDWARNRLGMKPQPAPPIYQPDVAADAVMRAVRSGERELFVGKSVVQLIFGHMVAPGWLNRKMASAGAEMQKSGDDEPGNRPDNVFEPVKNMGAVAHGRFDDRAKNSGLIVNGDTMRYAVFGGVPALTLLIGLLLG